jgi:hypothetical protein
MDADKNDIQHDWYKEYEKKKWWRLFALILLAVIIYNAKREDRWFPDLDDGTLTFKYSNWWGFDQRTFYPEWRKESNASSEDVERWCVKYPDGTWHTLIWRYGDDGLVDIYLPPKQ